MLHHCNALIGNPLRSYFSGHELHLFLCSTWQYYACRVSLLIITWKTSFHNFELCEQWKGGKAWSYNPLRYRVFSIETANKKEKYLIFWTISQTRRNAYQMQSSFKRILAVLGLSVSLRVVKDERWQEKTVADIETDGFSSQPANSSPARDPSNCADPKLPVTPVFTLIFQMCPGKFLSKPSVPWYCLLNHTFKNASCSSWAVEESQHSSTVLPY